MYVFHELPGGFPLVHALLIDDVLLVLVRPMTPQGSMICSTLSDGCIGVQLFCTGAVGRRTSLSTIGELQYICSSRDSSSTSSKW